MFVPLFVPFDQREGRTHLPNLKYLVLEGVFEAGNGTRTRDFNLGKVVVPDGITRKLLI